MGEIASETRIGVRLLKAIEEEAFDRLPGGIYNKAFLRQYTAFLGLNQEEVVQEYVLLTTPKQEEPPLATIVLQPELTSQASATRGLWQGLRQRAWRCWEVLAAGSAAGRMALASRRNLPAAGMILLALVALFFLVLRSPDSSELPPAREGIAASAGTTEASKASAPVPEQSTPSSLAPRTSKTPDISLRKVPLNPVPPVEVSSLPLASLPLLLGPSPLPSPPEARRPGAREIPTFSDFAADELLLEISARSEVWLYITADGVEFWQGILQPNQTRQVQALESIRMTIGNAGGVELMLNGKPLGALGRDGEVKRIAIAGTPLPSVTP